MPLHMRMCVASALLALAALCPASAQLSPALSSVAAPAAWDALVTALDSRLARDDDDGSCVAWDPLDEADAPVLCLSFSSKAFSVTHRDHAWTSSGVYAASRIAADGESELELVGPARALRTAIDAVAVQASDAGSHRVTIQRQRFRLRVDGALRNSSVRTYHLATTRPAVGAAGLVGTLQLGVRLLDGDYASIGDTIRGLVCSSAMLSPAATAASFEAALREMPCVVTTPDGVAPERREVQVLSIEAVTPETTLEDHAQELVTLSFQGQPSATVPVGATDAALLAQLRILTTDAALVISRVADGDRRRRWEVTFSTIGAQHLVGASMVDALTPLRTFSSVSRRGISASDVRLSLFYPSLSVHVRDSRQTRDLHSLALGISVWTGDEDVEPPRIVLMQSAIEDGSTGEAIPVTLGLESPTEAPSLVLVVDGRRSPVLSASSSAIASAIAAGSESNIEAVDVTEESMSDGDPMRSWAIELTSTTSVALEAIEDGGVTTATSVSLIQEHQEVMGRAVDGAVSTTLTEAFSKQRLYRATMGLRLLMPISPPRFAAATSMPSLRVGEELTLSGIEIEGDDIPVSLAVRPRVGVVVSSTAPLAAQVVENGLVWSGATPTLLNRIFAGPRRSVVYRVSPQSTDLEFLPLVTYIDCQLKYTLSDSVEVVDWAMPIQILPEEEVPAALYVPFTELRLAGREERSFVGMELKSDPRRRYSSTRATHRVRVTSHSGGEVFLHDTARRFVGKSVRFAQDASSIDVQGSIDLVNFALQGLRYKAPRRGESDAIVLLHESDFENEPHVHHIRVHVTPVPQSVRINWNGNRLSWAGVVQSEEDAPIGLGSLSVEFYDGLGSADPSAESAIMSVIVSSSHGIVRLVGTTVPAVVSGPADNSALHLIGNRSTVNRALSQATYTPPRNYNGPDAFEISVVPDASSTIVLSATDVLHVFLKPVDDPLRLHWAQSQSNVSQMQIPSCCISYNLPTLVLADDGDKYEAKSASFFLEHRSLQASIEVPAASHIDLLHDATPATTRKTVEKGDVRSLHFEGSSKDVRKLLTAVSILPSWRTLVAVDGIELTVRITSRDAANGRMGESVSAVLLIDIDREAFLRTIPRQEVFTQVAEDQHLQLSTLSVLAEFVKALGGDTNLVLYCSHGVLSSASSDSGSTPSRNMTFRAQTQSQRNANLMQLNYAPDRDYVGPDELFIGAGDLRLSVHILVRAVNDAPTLQFAEMHRENKMIARYLPVFSVWDADDGDIVAVALSALEEEVYLVLEDPTVFRAAGVWVQNLRLDQVAAFAAREIRVRGHPSVLNQVFGSPTAVRIESRNRRLSATTIRACVSDGQSSFCTNQPIDLPRLELFLLRVAAPGMLSIAEGQAQPIRELVSLNISSLQSSETASVRLSTTLGLLRRGHNSSVTRDECHDSVVTRYLHGKRPTETQVWLNGTLRCIQQLLEQMDYVPLRTTGMSATARLAIDFSVGDGGLCREVFEIELQQAEPTHRVRFTRRNSNAGDSSTAWRLSRVVLTPLRQFGDLGIVSRAVTDRRETDPTEDGFLSLNVSCSPSCVISSDAKTGVFIPRAVYVDAPAAASRERRYFGIASSLHGILQSLHVQLNVDQEVSEGAASIVVALASVATEHSRRAKTVVATTTIPFRFVVVAPRLKWRLSQNEFEAHENGRALMDVVSVDELGHDPHRHVHVSVLCSPSAVILMNSNVSASQVVEKPCDQRIPISLVAPLVEMNTALARMSLRLEDHSLFTPQIAMHLVLMAAEGDFESVEDNAEIIVNFRSQVPPHRRLQELIAAANTTIVADEGGVVALGEVFVAQVHSAADLYQLSLSADRGTLSIPIDDICCVHVMGRLHGSRVGMEGTLTGLQGAVSRVLYRPPDSYFGVDRVTLTIEGDASVGSQPVRNLWAHVVRVGVQAVNNAPRIQIRAVGTKSNASTGLAQTEVSIHVDDVDVGRRPAVLQQLNVAEQQPTDGKDPGLQCAVHTTSGSIVIPQWSKVRMSVANSGYDVHSQHDRSLGDDTLQATSFNFSAPLASINSVLRVVLLIHNITSCSDLASSAETPALIVTVNDRGHGLADVWEPRQVTEAFSVCDDLWSIEHPSTLSLELPPEAAHLDTKSRTLTISGLVVRSDSFAGDEEVSVRVEGAVAVQVLPEVQRVQLVGPQHLQVMTVTLTAADSPVTAVGGSFELLSTVATSSQRRSVMVFPQAVAMKVKELKGDVGAGRGPMESMEALLGLIYGETELKRRRVHIDKTVDDGGLTAEWRVVAFLDPGVSALPPLQIGAVALAAPSGSAASVVTDSSTVAGRVHGFFTLALGADLVTRKIRAEAGAHELQDALDELTAAGVVTRVVESGPFTWDVTFMRPGSNVPLLQGDASALSPGPIISDTASPVMRSAGTRVDVSRLAAGLGQGSLYQIDVNATTVGPVYRVEAPRTSASARLGGGWFRLGFRTTSDAVAETLVETKDIAWDAVALRRDEGVLTQAGGHTGNSIESALHQALGVLAESTAQPWLSATRVLVDRSSSGTPTWYAWAVTFADAPVDFPELVVTAFSSSALSAVTVTPVRFANAVSGHFTLSVASAATAPLPVSASATDVEAALSNLATVRDATTGVGRVMVRRKDLPRVGGASFSVLFVEEVASAVTPHRVTADGALLEGLGAFVRVKRLEAAAMNGEWHFATSGSDSVRFGSSLWAGAVRANISTGSFELHGPVSRVGLLLSEFSFLLSSDWCCGLVSVALRVQGGGPVAVVASAQSDPQTLPFEAPHYVDVALHAGTADRRDLSVERGAVDTIPSVHLTVPAWALNQLWVSAHVRARDGQLRLQAMESETQSKELWVNGTVAMVNAQLGGLHYFSELATSFLVDFLSVDVFADITRDRLGQAQFLIRIFEPPLEPKVVVEQTSQPSADEGVDAVLDMRDDEPLAITGIQVSSQRTTADQAEQVELTLRVDLGRLDFAYVDRIVVLRSDRYSKLVLRGTLQALNEALQTLRYEPSQLFSHERDTLTARLAYQPHKRPLVTDVKRLRINIRRAVQLPRVTLGSNKTTGIIAVSSMEDSGFQFPSILLAQETRVQSSRSRNRRRVVAELRRTDLRAPLVTKSGLGEEESRLGHWRHRWVADFPALRISSGAAFAAAGASSFVFTGSDLSHGEELWVSDGTAAGTRLLLDLMPGNGSSTPSDFAAAPGSVAKIMFAADGIDASWTLQTARDCNRARVSSVNPNIQFIVAASSVWDPTASYDCPRGWRWATTSEARSVFDSPPLALNLSEPFVFWGACDWQGYTFGGVSRKHFRFADSRVTGATKHAGRRDSAPVELSFATTDFAGIVCIRDESLASASGRELWMVDVPSQTATRVFDVEPGPRGSDPRFLTPYLSEWIVFQAITTEHGTELFKTDGSASGTVLVEDIWRGPRSSDPSDFGEWASAVGGDGRMYFAATTDAGRELWSTDGSSSFTSERDRRAVAGLRIGTALVRDICAGSGSSEPRFLTPLGAMGIFFAASDCLHGRELWVTDGTSTGTKMVKDLNPTPGEGSDPTDLVAFNGKLYFAATSDGVAMRRELVVSDGTSTGTRLLVELAPGVPSASPSGLSVADSKLYLHASDSRGHAALWSSDGTASGTGAVWDSLFAQQYQFVGPPRLWAQNNALFYFVERATLADEAVEHSAIAHDGDDEFGLNISVSSGSISVAGATNSRPSPSVALVGSVRRLQSLLSRLLYHPPLNWNSHQLPLGDHVVQWRFLMSSPLVAGSVSSTVVDLIVRSQPDPPVIVVPSSLADPIHFSSDYLSRLRSVCLPITVLEDVPTPVPAFSVRAVDDRGAQDETHTWTLDVEVDRGRVDMTDRRGCLKSLDRGRLRGTQLLRVSSSRVQCLSQLLETMRYTSSPDTSGADALRIRVARSSPTQQPTEDAVVVPVVVLEVNDAPYVVSPSGFYYEATEDQARIIQDLAVVDPDATGDITVDLRVLHGSVGLLNAGAVVTTPATLPASQLTITGSVHNVNAALSGLVYTSAKDWNSLLDMHASDGLDEIRISVSDGQPANASTRASVHVYVQPAPDPVVIATPTVSPTSVYAYANDATLHGDEDEWLAIASLNFSTVDEVTSRTAVDVTLRVGHGTLDFGGAPAGVTTSGSSLDGSYWRLRGGMDDVNRAVSRLRYMPSEDFVGADALTIVAGTFDRFASSTSLERRLVVPIEIHCVNDAPRWILPSATIGWTQNAPTRIEGVMLADVDCRSPSPACVIEVVIECTASALLAFPRLAEAALDVEFTSAVDATQSPYAVLSGPLESLNIALSEIVLTTKDQDAEALEPAEIWLTADDRGHSGSGGPQITQSRLVITPLRWVAHKLSLVAPDDTVLTLAEDASLPFSSSTLRLEDRDALTRTLTPLYEVAIGSTHGAFRLSSSTSSASGLLMLSTTDRTVRFRGFLPQINAALNGSSYVPERDWFGSDEITISAREITASDRDAALASVFVYVEPACDEPYWNQTLGDDADIELDEDGQALLSDVEIVHPDDSVDGGGAHVTLSVTALDGGGVMLATTQGLEISGEESPPWVSLQSLALLFFARVQLTGRVASVNAALRGLIYRPLPDFHSDGHVVDVVQLEITSTSCTVSAQVATRSRTIRAQIHAVADALQVDSTRFARVTSREIDLDLLHHAEPSLEAVGGQLTPLDAITLVDPDAYDDASDAVQAPPAEIRLRLSCRSCILRPSTDLERLQLRHGILTSRTDPGADGSAWSPTWTFHGSLSELNNALLSSLVFVSAPQFHGHAVVLLRATDMERYGRGQQRETAFAMVVRVRRTNTPPRILVPPYGPRQPPLEVDELSSVLLSGATPTQGRRPTPARYGRRVLQLMAVDPFASESAARVQSLLDVEVTGAALPALRFYAPLHPQQLLFSALAPTTGAELWTSDGTANGTRLLRDISPGPRGSDPQFLTRYSVDGFVYFAASGPNTDAWRIAVDHRDTCGGFRPSSSAPGVFFLVAASPIWNPDATYDCPVGYRWMTTEAAARVFIGTVATHGAATEPLVYYRQCGWDGYVWGGVERRHFRFADSRSTGAYKHAGHRDSYRVELGFDTLGFAGIVCTKRGDEEPDEETWSTEIWRSDGTPDGTRPVSAIGSSAVSAAPRFITEFRSRLFFQATSEALGSELWSSDGTRSGAQLVADIAFGKRSSAPEQLAVADGQLFFSATTELLGRELWVSDGEPRGDFAHADHTASSTRLVLDIRVGPESSNPLFLVALPSSGLLLFQADDGVNGAELWRSDGAATGTSLVLDIRAGPVSSSPQFLVQYGGAVYFQADDGVHGAELWVTDGTAANTKMLVDVSVGVRAAAPRYMAVMSLSSAEEIVFAAASDRNPRVVEFWRSDGSSTGTSRLFADSREAATPFDASMRELHRPWLIPMGRGFVFIGEKPRELRADAATSDVDRSLLTQSIVLEDDEPDGDRNYTLTLQCDYGSMSLSRRPELCRRAVAGHSTSPAATLSLRGNLADLNCAVAEVVYHATARDDAIVAILAEESLPTSSDREEGDEGRAYQVRQRIPVRVLTRNHPPVVDAPTRLFVPLGRWIKLTAIRVDDEDVGAARLLLRMSASMGRLRLVAASSVDVTELSAAADTDPAGGSAVVELSASVSEIAALLSGRVEYACLVQDGCGDGALDAVTITVDDNGFTGSGGPQSSTRVVEMVVLQA